MSLIWARKLARRRPCMGSTSTPACMQAGIAFAVHVCVSVHVCISIYIYVYIYISLSLSPSFYVYILYVYIYIYTHVHVFINKHTSAPILRTAAQTGGRGLQRSNQSRDVGATHAFW